MNQNNYIEEVFKRFNIEKCKPVRTPFDANFKLLTLSDDEFKNVQREIKVQGRGRIYHVCNDGYEGQYCICGEYGEPIHFEGRSTTLDVRETCHEVFEGLFELQIMH
jgi:hypothetical protein